MAPPPPSTLEQLAEMFGRNQEELIAEWRIQAGELLRERRLDKLAITNNIPFLITAITHPHPRRR